MHRIVLFTFIVVLGLIVGCSNKGSNVAANAPVLDVAPIPTPEPMPAAAAPEVTTVAFAPSPAPVSMLSAPTAASSKTYTVKKGDTLFSIAKNQLGSGRDWQKIAAANPGLTPQKLKAGQQIAMP